MKRANAAVVLATLSLSLNLPSTRLQKEVRTDDLPLSIPSGFAQRGAERLGDHHTSPATRSLLFGNSLDFVSARRGKKRGKFKDTLEFSYIHSSLRKRIKIILKLLSSLSIFFNKKFLHQFLNI